MKDRERQIERQIERFFDTHRAATIQINWISFGEQIENNTRNQVKLLYCIKSYTSESHAYFNSRKPHAQILNNKSVLIRTPVKATYQIIHSHKQQQQQQQQMIEQAKRTSERGIKFTQKMSKKVGSYCWSYPIRPPKSVYVIIDRGENVKCTQLQK